MSIVYVTPDDFKNSAFGGFDLVEALSGANNESRAAENMIELVTENLMAWIDTNSFRNFRWDRLTPFQLEYWRKAIIAQVYYTYKEGPKAWGMFSGIDDEKGRIVSIEDIKKVEICDTAIKLMTRAGIYNLTIKNRRRTWPSGGNYGFF